MGSLVDMAQFAPLLTLQNNWRAISAECAALDRRNILDIDREGKSHEEVARAIIENGQPKWVEAWGEQKEKWLNWGFGIHDQYPLGDAGAPRTVDLLRHIRGLKVAALSLFKPGLLLPVHTHPELADEGLLTFHLGLEVPRDYCYLNADGEFVREEEGRALVFDGSRPHYAFNASSVDRLILYCEFSYKRLKWIN
jgi:aspartyl/asparaginyl beta-hydroxylase (cupin superfamily)